jgi:hypothetical protein
VDGQLAQSGTTIEGCHPATALTAAVKERETA